LYHRKTQPQPLIDQRVPSYNFDVIDGITMASILANPARYDQKGKWCAQMPA